MLARSTLTRKLSGSVVCASASIISRDGSALSSRVRTASALHGLSPGARSLSDSFGQTLIDEVYAARMPGADRTCDNLSSLSLKSAASRSRSEEHTSELQSRGHLVCRLLLEKKKQNATTHNLLKKKKQH